MSLDHTDPASPDPQTGRGARPALADVLVSVFIFSFAATVVAVALTLKKAPPAFVGEGMQPRTFPIFLMVVIGLMNGFLLRETLLNPPPRREPLEGMVWVTIALMGVFALVTTFVDMMVAMAIVIFAKTILWGERRIFVAASLALLTPLTILVFFDVVLEVRFPRGLLTNLYYG
ncbi:MAG: tripartite tricarboxylate transporter TctB family protein [Pseudomonadota bacterium]